MKNEIRIELKDGLDGMDSLENSSVDLILIDPPYGTVDNIPIWEDGKGADWGVLDTVRMLECCNRVLRQGGRLITFSQGSYTVKLLTEQHRNMRYNYRYVWNKGHFGNPLNCRNAPVMVTEDILVFTKKYDTYNDDPLRNYSRDILTFLSMTPADLHRALGHRKADHFMRCDSEQFAICSEQTYNDILNVGLSAMDGVLTYEQMLEYKEASKTRYDLRGKRHKPDLLSYKRDTDRYHPTQKPVALLMDLIETYTTPTETVLDFVCGSGSTGVAAKELGRSFIGFEIDERYFDIARKRLAD